MSPLRLPRPAKFPLSIRLCARTVAVASPRLSSRPRRPQPQPPLLGMLRRPPSLQPLPTRPSRMLRLPRPFLLMSSPPTSALVAAIVLLLSARPRPRLPRRVRPRIPPRRPPMHRLMPPSPKTSNSLRPRSPSAVARSPLRPRPPSSMPRPSRRAIPMPRPAMMLRLTKTPPQPMAPPPSRPKRTLAPTAVSTSATTSATTARTSATTIAAAVSATASSAIRSAMPLRLSPRFRARSSRP